MGYAGGTRSNPNYHNLGDHSETVQIVYDPGKVSYEELLEVFWAENGAVNSLFSRQYNSIIFYHNSEQKKMAEESYERRMEENPNTVLTEIIPYAGFYFAEPYHQKYYLQSEQTLLRDALSNLDEVEDFLSSTTAARLNGYIGGFGDQAVLEKEIDSYGLSEKGEETLRRIAERGLRPACPVPAK